jgi:hypothetical protein
MKIQYIAFFVFLAVLGVADAWWDPNYLYRSNIQLSSSEASNLSDFTYNLTFDSATPIGAGKMLSNCFDVRFTWVNATDGAEYLIPYHLYADVGFFATTSNSCSGGNSNALAHIRIPQLYGNGVNTSLYIYYGYAGASKGSNADATYLFWDDFSAGLNGSKWNVSSGTGLSGTWMVVTGSPIGYAFTNYSTGIINTSFNQSLKVMSIFKDTIATARGLYGIDVGESSFGASGALTGTAIQSYHVTYNTSRTEAFINNALSQADIRKYRNFYGYWSSGGAASVSFTNVSAVGFSYTPIYSSKNIVEESAPTTYQPKISDFAYFQNIEIIANPLNPKLEDFVLNITFDSLTPIGEGKLQSSCNDLRFAYLNSTGDYNFIPYYLYEDVGTYGSTAGKCYGGNANALAFVRIPIIYNTSSTYLRMYYGNSSVSAGSNPSQTYLFYDYPQGTLFNLSNWDTNCPAGTTCDVTSNYNRLRIDSGSPTARTGASSSNFPSSFWNKWNSTKRILTMQSSGGDGAAGYQDICTSGSTVSCTHGYDLFASGVNDATWRLVQLDFNSTNTRCYVGGSACSVGTGSPTTNAPNYYGYEVANTAPEQMRATNITVVSWAKYYPTYSIYTLGSGNLNITAYDESSGANIYFNASITNGSSTYVTPNALSHLNSSIYFPQGSNTITFQNASYYTRQIISTILNNSQTIQIYLLPISNPSNVFVRFTAVDGAGASIPNVLINITKGTNQIESKYTDAAGVASFYLDYTQSYTVVSSKIGYPTIALSPLIPTQQDYYIQMSQSNVINPQYTFTNISWSLLPDPRKLYQNSSVIKFTIQSQDSQLEYFGLALEYQNAIIFNFTNSTSPAGGNITVYVDLSSRVNGSIIAHPYFKKFNFIEYYDSSSYFPIANETESPFYNATGLMKFVSGIRQSGLSREALGFVLMFFCLIFSAIITRTIGVGAGIVALIFLSFAALFGIFAQNPADSPFIYNTELGREVPNTSYWGVFAFMVLVIIAIIIVRVTGLNYYGKHRN